MSDFLTRLAQRQFGKIAAIEPRLPGLYAPVADAMAFQTGGLDTEYRTNPDIEQKTGAMPEELSKPVMIKDLVVPANASPGTLLEAHRPLVPSPKITREHVLPVATESVVEGPENSSRWLRGMHGSTLNPTKPLLVPDPTAAPSHDPSKHAVNESPLLEQRSLVRAGQSEEAMLPRLVQERVSDRSTASHRLNSLTAPAQLVHGAGPARERVGDDTEPPVHVTIGRIEVTAVTAAQAQPRPPSPRKPSMSLNDYLAWRQGRDR